MGKACLTPSEENCFSRSRSFLPCVLFILLFCGKIVFLQVWKKWVGNSTPWWLSSLLMLGEGEGNMQPLEGEVWTQLEGCSQDCRWLNLLVLVCYNLPLRHHSWAFLNSFCPRWEDNILVFHFTARSQVDHDNYMSQVTHTNFLACSVWNRLSFVVVPLVVNDAGC